MLRRHLTSCCCHLYPSFKTSVLSCALLDSPAHPLAQRTALACSGSAATSQSWVQVFMLPSNTKLDRNTMKHVLRMGHSRVPVHEPGDR